ncbi:MAG: cytochrome b [Proteobacteria bacterium]|nr:cytochrome b [Pseudomonadota bacterium]
MVTDPLETSRPLHEPGRYGTPAIVLHWLTFALVVIVGVLGLLHDDWPKQTQSFWINMHAVLGTFLWLMLLARLTWRIRQPPPPAAANLSRFALRFSSPVHMALYALLFVIPLVGFVTFVYHGRVFDFGFFQIDFGIEKNRAVFHPTEDIHGYLAYALFALATLHAAAALWHHFYLRDGVLQRMCLSRRKM